MKYIQEFETIADYNDARQNDYIEHGTSLTDSNGDINYDGYPDTKGISYVDLGLPSGNLGATSNLPKYFYRWGELEGTTLTATINANTYRGGSDLTKYNNTDHLTKLQLEDDAARVIRGGDGCIPTIIDFEELFDNVTVNSTATLTVTFKSNINNATITFQKYGYKISTATNSYGNGNGAYGHFGTCELDPTDISKAKEAVIADTQKFISSTNRYYGLCVRPIIRRVW